VIEITNIQTTSAAVSITTPPVDLGDLTRYSIETTFSGSNVVGVLTLESSNYGVIWNTISGSTQAIAASANHIYDVVNSSYRYYRLKWVYTSGTGNIGSKSFIKEETVKVRGS